MVLSRQKILLFVVTLCSVLAGCKKSDTAPGSVATTNTTATALPAPPPSADISRIHWLGKKRLGTETNALAFMEIWKLPESANLEAATLDKLALAPWRMLKGDAATNGAPTALLRTLLDDLIQEESYAEIHHPANQAAQSAFAIRLTDERAGVWETNLATVIESLTGVRPAPAASNRGGWILKKPDTQDTLELVRHNGWVSIGLAQGSNAVLGSFASRIERDRAPVQSATNFWLDAVLNLPRIAKALALNWHLPTNAPQIVLTAIGDGQNVRLRGELNFPGPLGITLPPWSIPTNLIHDPLIGFSAVRGIGPWLSSQKIWKDLQLGEPPNQAFFWTQQGQPWMRYVALPSNDASNQIAKIGDYMLKDTTAIVADPRLGGFDRSPGSLRVRWRGIPLFFPVIDAVQSDGNNYLFAGFGPNAVTNRALPLELLPQLYANTNLIWYDWEFTQPCADGLMQIIQLSKRVVNRARLTPDNPAFGWLRAIPAHLGNSVTGVRLIAPDRISFSRSSTLGLTGMELHLLADWFESPKFPQGLHALDAPAPPLPP